MPVTINDIAQASEDPLYKAVLMQVLQSSDLIARLPWITKNSLEITGVRVQTLPTAGFRQFNAGYNESTGDLEQWTDGIFPFGLDMYFEKQYMDVAELIEPAEVTQSRAALQSISMDFNNNFINGVVGGGGFAGLLARVMDAATPAQCRINLATLGDCLKVLANDANQHTFLDALDEAIDAVGGKANMILCARRTKLVLTSIMRRQGLLDQTRDQFGRVVLSYQGADIINVGQQSDLATDIITETEDPGDAGDDSTSLYVVRTGTPDGDSGTIGGDGLHGIQKNTLNIYDPLNGNEMEARPAFIRRVDWPITISQLGDRTCVARVYGFRPRAA